MEGLLKCPHGLVTGCEERQGLKIYRHLQDGEACGLLNGLQLTPEEILLEMGQTFVSSGNFTALAPYVRGGELAEGYVPPQASTALNEFLLFFHASAAVRSLIYETVLTAAVSGDDITFKELLELALFALCYARFQEETRTYKRKVKELLPYFGAGLLDVLAALKIDYSRQSAVSCFYEEYFFPLKYEFWDREVSPERHKQWQAVKLLALGIQKKNT